MAKWCWNWPHCACGLVQARELSAAGQKLLIYRDGTGDIKRVPCSEIETLAIVEGIDEKQLTSGCPKSKGNASAETS